MATLFQTLFTTNATRRMPPFSGLNLELTHLRRIQPGFRADDHFRPAQPSNVSKAASMLEILSFTFHLM
jgi:hypothetical protein